MTPSRDIFETMPVPRAVRTMAVPTVFGQLIILAYNLADTFFIGRADNPFMVGAVSLILPVFNICISIAALSGVGGSALVSRLLGARREEEARKVFTFSVAVSIGAALLFSLLTGCFLTPLLRLLGATPDTFGYARTYALCVIVAGGLPTILTNVFSSFVRCVGESRKAAFGITLGGVINMALDPLFMFVLLPAGNEILGAGLATCVSNGISCAYFLLVLRKLKKNSPLYTVSLRNRPEKRSVWLIFSVGIPSSLATLLFDLDYIVIDRLMASYSDIALAAVGIVLKAERLPLNIGIGICQGMIPLVAYNYASGRYDRMKSVARFSLLTGIVCALFSIVLYETLAPYILKLFISDAATVALGTRFLRIRSLATVLMFMSFYHVHLFNSYGRGGEALFLGVMRWGVFNIPMLFLLNGLFGMYGIVWAQLAADVLTVTLSLIVHHRFTKKHLSSFPTP